MISNWMQDKRAEREARAARRAELRAAVEGASNAFTEAKVTLDQALTGQQTTFQSVPHYVAMSHYTDQLTLGFGSASDPAVVAFRKARDKWTDALNLAIKNAQQNAQAIADARNEAEEARKEFMGLAAPRVAPGLSKKEQQAVNRI